MTVRTRILLLSSAAFLCFFVFGVTESGQSILIGNLPPGADHWTADDIAVGAGLTPLVYGLVPFFLLFFSGLLSWFLDHRRKSG